MKRCIDILLSSLCILVCLPLLVFLALLVRVKLGSPVIFTQLRSGWYGAPFKIIKFRSMTAELDANGSLLPDSQRLRPLGVWLRSTSLDELPSLFLVLKGDLSLVGPRPLLVEYVPLYTSEQARRLEVRPGITGWAQVNGRNSITWEEKFELDVWYVDNCSIWVDLKILILTVKKVLFRDGISSQNDVTMERFKGSNKNG